MVRPTKVLGIALLALGILAVVLSEFGYTRERHSAEFGGLEIEVEERERLEIPLWLGLGVAAAGAALLLYPSRPVS